MDLQEVLRAGFLRGLMDPFPGYSESLGAKLRRRDLWFHLVGGVSQAPRPVFLLLW